jgi:S-adenosylmethionine:tRNA ribosyltransferase-isomerase
MSAAPQERVEDFDYVLPPEQIAQRPAPERQAAKLLIADIAGAPFAHHQYAALPQLVRGDELFVLNDTRVVPARLFGHKPTGGRVELLVLGLEAGRVDLVRAMGRASKPIRTGTSVDVGGHPLTVTEVLGGGLYLLKLPESAGPLWGFLDAHGELPLPPYITRAEGPDADDRVRYQTVFAEHPGSVAAPTAGLHFTPELLGQLEARGCKTARVTLHVGPGTFLPVRADSLDAHEMHAERYVVSDTACATIQKARAEGRPIVAVGTTVTRTLEAVVAAHGALVPDAGETRLFIRPGWRFEVVDQLLTNFHLPRSTLLMLVSALLGRERTMAAYAEALTAGYRFYSYGDGMWAR